MQERTDFSFRGQREDENVLGVIHFHPWALAKPGAIIALGLAFLIIMFMVFQFSRPTVITLLYIGPILLLYALYSWYVWWNNLYVLTDQRMIVIIQRGLLSRRIEDYSLDKIQSVASSNDGLAATLLNFGTVMLAIMGIKEPVRLTYLEDPFSVQERILTAIKARESHQPLHHSFERQVDQDAEREPSEEPKRVLTVKKSAKRRLIQH